MASIVLLHKVPALWEVECKGDRGKNPGFSSDFDSWPISMIPNRAFSTP